MFTILKVLNSSVVLVKDEKGRESILLSKGIGYGRKQGEEVLPSDDGRVFIPVNDPESNKLKDALDEIPAVYLEIAQDIVEHAQKLLPCTLSNHIYLALTDHIHFAVIRQNEEMKVLNRIFWEVKNFYPKEFQVGIYGLKVISERIEIDLPEEEAANIAFHIVNAQKSSESQYDAMRVAKLIKDVITTVTYAMKCELDKDSLHFSRFMSHLQYFAERFFSNKMMDDEQDFLFYRMDEQYPKAIDCAERIRTLILREYNSMITNEEVAYLAIHIQRLVER